MMETSQQTRTEYHHHHLFPVPPRAFEYYCRAYHTDIQYSIRHQLQLYCRKHLQTEHNIDECQYCIEQYKSYSHKQDYPNDQNKVPNLRIHNNTLQLISSTALESPHILHTGIF